MNGSAGTKSAHAHIGYGYGSEWHLMQTMARLREEFDRKISDATHCESIRWLDFKPDERGAGLREFRGRGAPGDPRATGAPRQREAALPAKTGSANAPRFLALPVSQGDAFYLESSGISVLVDGGKNRHSFPCLFKQHTGRSGVDILVCTHNDADHANGVLGFLESGFGCGELWLPCTWLETIKALPGDPKQWNETFEALVDRVSNAVAKRARSSRTAEDPLEAYASSLSKERKTDVGPSPSGEGASRTLDAWLGDDIDSRLSDYEFLTEALLAPWLILRMILLDPLNPIKYRSASSILQAGKRIIDIARAALHRGIMIRCFRYAHPPAPIPTNADVPLIPVNSVPSGKLGTTLPADTLLTLTADNRESLSFWYQPNKRHPGVLFTAETNLYGVTLPDGLSRAIVTAPHHGSAYNKDVYTKISQDVIWVRSDGFSTTRPCQEYLAKKEKYCTMCRETKPQKQIVRLSADQSGNWVPVETTQRCKCGPKV
jgi:hypothetical protein